MATRLSPTSTARFSEGWGDIGMASVGLYVGAASLAAIRSRVFPRWIGHLGLVVAASALVSLAGAILPTSVPMSFVGLFGFVLWNLVLGVALSVSGWRGRTRRTERGGGHCLSRRRNYSSPVLCRGPG